IEARPEPVSREEVFRLGRRPLALYFEGDAPDRIDKDVVTRRDREVRRRGDLYEFEHGLGRVLYAPMPIEANGNRDATAALYEFACRWAGVERVHRLRERDAAVTVRVVVFGRSRLYGIVSDASEGRDVEFVDRPSGTRVRTLVDAGRANLILVRDSG